MGEFVKQVSEQATEALREVFGQEPLPGQNPLRELMGLLLGDGFGDVQPPPTIPITSQQWLDWHHLALMKPNELTAAMNLVLQTEQKLLPRQREAMRASSSPMPNATAAPWGSRCASSTRHDSRRRKASGLMIYQMLTGLPAESFPSLGARAREIAGNPLLQRLNRLSLRAAQRDPAKRFQDAGAMLAELEASASRRRRFGRRVLAWSACVALVAVVVGAILWRTGPWWRGDAVQATAPTDVEVNFLTEPYFNATIYVDGELLVDAEGKPYTTPCTVPTVPTGEHQVVFKHAGYEDLDAGGIDFDTVREVNARWPDARR